MRKVIVTLLGAALFAAALGVGQLVAGTGSAAASSTTTERGDDRGGAEHARRRKRARTERARAARREAGEDVRGPCDEAEHANDPRCNGGADDDDNDRRGSNSGRG